MTPSLLAILARFNGDRTKAIVYCSQLAVETTNPILRNEYTAYCHVLYFVEEQKW